MLHSLLRLGPHDYDLTPSTFRKTAFGLTAAAAMVAASAFPAAAQQAALPLTGKQCSDAVSIALSLVKENEGRISRGLIDSFVKFSKTNCDLNTDWKLTGKKDEEVFGQFRTLLIAMRTAQVSKPAVLAKQ